MSRTVRDRLRAAEPPDATGARERARELILAAHEQRPAARSSRRRRARAKLPAALAVAVGLGGAAAATAPGAGVRDWIGDLVDRPTPPPRAVPVLQRLPAAGRVLVSGPGGTWVVGADGRRRRLGPYGQATWSPQGRFVAATRGRQLVALEPGGAVRWSLGAQAPVRDPRWAPSGFRIAYRSGTALRVVAGDGSGDRLIAAGVAAVAPSWRPAGPRNELTYVDGGGRLVRVDVDRGTVLARTPSGQGGPARSLQWSRSGRRLLVTGRRGARLLGPSGTLVRRYDAPAGTVLVAAALSPRGHRVASVHRGPSGRHTVLVTAPDSARARTLFAAVGAVDSVTWSPDGRFVLAPWSAADQWLLLGVRPGARASAVANVAMQFDVGRQRPRGGQSVQGWCCS